MAKGKQFPDLFIGIPVLFGYASTPQEFADLQKQANVSPGEQSDWCISPSANGKTGAVTHSYDRVVIVCAPLNSPDDYLVHEAVHVFQHMMYCIGEEAPGMEIQAYFIQAISKQLIAARNEKRAKARKLAKARVSTPKK